jgi:DNA repair protein RadA/Sms
MAAPKTVYLCSECGAESRRWVGRCPGCGSWNTMMEEIEERPSASSLPLRDSGGPEGSDAVALPDVPMEDFGRTGTGMAELDRVLGGGIVQGSLVLIGGDPGIGKSTLLLQAMENIASNGQDVLYVSGEESLRQIALRAQRLGARSPNLKLLAETNVERVLLHAGRLNPGYLVIDSIQTMYRQGMASSAGSVTQVRESASAFMQLAKERGCSVFLVGHVTKAGALAGPRVLEHLVDTVLYFEGDNMHAYRILRAAKNRFGSTNEIGLFEMRDTGMREVANPSEMLLSDRSNSAGSIVAVSVEGTRPMLVEIQALVSSSAFGTPRRMATGIDYGRMAMLIAVLEKRAGLSLYDQDVYINVAGGLKLEEPAADLGVALAIASGLRGRPLPDGVAVFGEIGLTGEIRPVSRPDIRISECAKVGFSTVVLPKRNLKGVKAPDGMEVVEVSKIQDALSLLI